MRHLTVAAHQRAPPCPHRLDPLPDHLMMGDRSLDAFDRSRRAGLQVEACPYKRLQRLRDHHRPGRRQVGHPRGHVGGQPVDLVVGGVHVNQPAMHPDPDADIYPKPALCLLVEPKHLAGDLQTRQHRPARIVLMGSGVAENRQ